MTRPDLEQAIRRAFEEAGSHVAIGPQLDNLVRRSTDEDATSLPYVIESQGLPNLLHEFAHFVQRGRLEVDHGTPYERIPFSLARDEERRWLFEELACCVVSCAYLDGDLATREAWFDEQIGIQNIFYGIEDRREFLDRVDALHTERHEEIEAIVRDAFDRTARALRRQGYEESLREGPWTFRRLWRAVYSNEQAPPGDDPA